METRKFLKITIFSYWVKPEKLRLYFFRKNVCRSCLFKYNMVRGLNFKGLLYIEKHSPKRIITSNLKPNKYTPSILNRDSISVKFPGNDIVVEMQLNKSLI